MRDPEALLEHAGWLRALARSLVADAHRAEDVVQETFAAALEHPPRDRGRLRAWLGTVARNAARSTHRSDVRREKRERASRAPEPPPEPGELVERLELHRRLVDHVHALEEPLRTTVLLRYFEGLTPAEIALRYGIPASTVRTRLKRALAALRGRLDRDHGGDRRAWTLALLPLALPSVPVAAAPAAAAPSAWVLGGLIVGAKTKLLIAVVVLALLVLGAWRLTGSPPTPTGAPDDAGRTAAANATEEEPDAPADGEATVEEVDGENEPAPDGAAADGEGPEKAGAASPRSVASAGAAAGTIEGRVLVPEGFAALGTKIRLQPVQLPTGEKPPEVVLEADVNGAFRFDGLSPGGFSLRAEHPDLAPWSRYLVLQESRGETIEIPLRQGGTILIRVLGANGDGLPGQSVNARGSTRTGGYSQGRTDAEGICRLTRLPAGPYHVIWNAKGSEILKTTTVGSGGTVELTFSAGATLTGIVSGPDGSPLPNAIVRVKPAEWGGKGYRSYQGRTDDAGRYRVQGMPPGEHTLTIQALPRDGSPGYVPRRQLLLCADDN
jgi:RNA polymerase sigma-70 factor (ECF subfamily)